MEVVGSVATVVGLLQAGLSLAKALNTYAGTVHDSNDDIAVIADDIYATYRHLSDLDLVLKQNEKAGILTADALESARKCVKQAEILIIKLKKLLVKGGNADATEIVESAQIDIGKFRKGIWYIYKSEFELRRSELAQIKADISLIYLTYLALSAGTTVERKQAQDEMELVYNRKVVLSRKVKKAREQRDRDAETGPVDDDNELAEDDIDNVYGIPPELEDTAIIYDNVEALYREFENWLAQKEQRAEAQAAERKKVEDDAIARHQEALEKKARNVKVESEKLRDVLLQHGVPPQRVLEITKHVFPDSQGSIAATRDVSSGNSTTPTRPEKGIITEKADAGSLLDPLRDLNEPGGIAQLKAFYLQRVHASPVRSEIMKLEVAVSGQQLLQKRRTTQGKTGSASAIDQLSDFGGIPEDYVLQIRQELATLQSELGESWILLHAEPVRAEKPRFRLDRRKKTDKIVGVQIVIRKVSERNSYGRSDQDNGLETIEARTNKAAPEAALASMETSRTSRENPVLEYYPQHASRLVAHSWADTPSSGRRTGPYRRRMSVSENSSDSSPERDRSERRARFAPEVITIPSPRYNESASEPSQRWEEQSRPSRGRRYISTPRWDDEQSPLPTMIRTNSGISINSDTDYRPAFRRRESLSPTEGEYTPTSIKINRRDNYLPTSTYQRSDRVRRTSARNRVFVPDRHRPQSAATSYAFPQRSVQRVPTSSKPRAYRRSINRSKASFSDNEEGEIIPHSNMELPPDAAVRNILDHWGYHARPPARETYESDTDAHTFGPLSRRSTIDVPGEDVHTTKEESASLRYDALNGDTE